MQRLLPLVLVLWGLLHQAAFAQTSSVNTTTPQFRRDVQPILERRCLGCHGVGATLGNLDLRSRQSALKGGVKGAAFVPGNANRSLLFQMVSGARTPQMPPNGKLPAAEIAILKKWLDAGGSWTDSLTTAKPQIWWSFVKPKKPSVPTVIPSVKVNPVDAFVIKKLKHKGLTLSPPASRRDLIRRGYFDLIGLPPTPEEVEAFEKDKSPDAWEKVIDRLLASPRYGERWGRHWLDVVRYADSGGFEGDKDRHHAWRYRDYVIDAFNTDMPYDQFIREQLAGDEIAPVNNRSLVATGYLAVGPRDIVMQNAKNRADELDDLVSTTGSAFLGLTIACARCHDHKYDPVKMSDYYRLSAIFAPTERREVEILNDEEKRNVADLDGQLLELRKQVEPLRARGLEMAKKGGNANPNEEQIVAALHEADKALHKNLMDRIKPLEAKRGGFPKAEIVTDKSKDYIPGRILLRGDADHPGDEVKPGFICSLPNGANEVTKEMALSQTTGRRIALANWIASPQNPLTSRVWMNRVWRHHFGRGLVNTPSNFGINGETPSHPELLDWLANTFVDGGWRLKPIHKLLMTSKTYRQDSRIRKDAVLQDPQNRLYWRMTVRRLEGEVIRDSILYVADSLNLQMGGPPVFPPIDPTLRADTFQGPNWQDGKDDPSTWRRSVYVKVKRSLLLPQLEVFDCPEITYTVAARNTTTTPTQALTLLNDPIILRQSERFAQRIEKLEPTNRALQVDHAYRLAFGRTPNSRERELSLQYLVSRERSKRPSPLADFCLALFNLNEFVYSP